MSTWRADGLTVEPWLVELAVAFRVGEQEDDGLQQAGERFRRESVRCVSSVV